jgi:predicted protein tyrosine phosphatase
MANIRAESSRSLVFGYSAKASELKAFIASLPDEATVTISSYAGDAREPAETTIQATWSEDA